MLDHIDITRFRGKTVGVALGGSSAERAISLKTGRAFVAALEQLGYDVAAYDIPNDLGRIVAERPAAVVLALHGGMGENGVIQGFLEALAIPYTGSGVMASALAIDKARAKAVLRDAGVPTPGGIRLGLDALPTNLEEVERVLRDHSLACPLVVKLNDSGSSFGVFISQTSEDVLNALGKLSGEVGHSASSGVLVEPYLDGPEYTVGFFDEAFLGAIEIVPSETFYDFKAKYESQQTSYVHVDDEGLKSRLESIGQAAYKALGCRGVARVDVKTRRRDEGLAYAVLEVNTIPGMTETSLIPKLAAKNGIAFGQFAELMLASASLETRTP